MSENYKLFNKMFKEERTGYVVCASSLFIGLLLLAALLLFVKPMPEALRVELLKETKESYFVVVKEGRGFVSEGMLLEIKKSLSAVDVIGVHK